MEDEYSKLKNALLSDMGEEEEEESGQEEDDIKNPPNPTKNPPNPESVQNPPNWATKTQSETSPPPPQSRTMPPRPVVNAAAGRLEFAGGGDVESSDGGCIELRQLKVFSPVLDVELKILHDHKNNHHPCNNISAKQQEQHVVDRLPALVSQGRPCVC
jgi:hypothetical protein